MPYVRIWTHLIWSTKNREPILEQNLRVRVFEHIKKNAKDKGIYLDTIDGHVEHVHTLVSLGQDQSIATVAQLLKGESCHWINETALTSTKFEWQDEYIAISVSESMIEKVRKYIRGQKEHHRKKSFAEEYKQILDKCGFQMKD